MRDTEQTNKSPLAPPLYLGLLVFLLILLGYRLLDFSVNRSDVADYIRWSRDLASYRSFPSHMPGYPVSLALARVLTLGWIGDVVLAQGICLASWWLAAVLAWRVGKQLAPETADTGVLLFSLFPFVGVTMAAYPIADAPAYALFLGACLAALRRRACAFALITSLGLLVHQAFYPFYLLLAVWCLLNNRISLMHFGVSGIPLVIYYVAIAIAEGNPNWILEYHRHAHLKASGALPIFDGIVGTLLRGSALGLVKGAFMFLVFVSACALSWHFLRKRNWLMLCFLAPLLVYSIVANQKIGWILIRMGKLLVFPFCVWLASQPRAVQLLRKKSFYIVLAVVLVVSQVAWAAYIYKYFSR